LRGLRLFIRPIEPSDRDALDALIKESTSRRVDESTSTPTPGDGASRELDDSTTRRLEDLPLVDSSTHRLVDFGLVGKLLGDIVAVTFVEEERDVLRVRELLVAETFRKKWIGRAMLAELEQLAKKLDKHSLVVDRDDAAGAEEFLRRTGFHGEGERWVRVVP